MHCQTRYGCSFMLVLGHSYRQFGCSFMLVLSHLYRQHGFCFKKIIYRLISGYALDYRGPKAPGSCYYAQLGIPSPYISYILVRSSMKAEPIPSKWCWLALVIALLPDFEMLRLMPDFEKLRLAGA